MTFIIDSENNITAFGSQAEAEGKGEGFSSQAELAEVASKWPASRLIEVWNSIPGLTPVKKFTDRKSAVSRIWKAIQSLGGTSAAEAATAAPKRANKAKPLNKQPKKTKTAAKENAPPAATSPPRRGTAARRPKSWAFFAARAGRRWPRS